MYNLFIKKLRVTKKPYVSHKTNVTFELEIKNTLKSTS